MKTPTPRSASGKQGSILAYFFVALVLLTAVASVTAYIVQTSNLASRRYDMVRALEYVEGGAAIACTELYKAFTNRTSTLTNNLAQNPAGAYVFNASLSTNGSAVFERTITSPYTNQSVKAVIWLPAGTSITNAAVVAQATVGKVTQQTTTYAEMKFGYGAAILSDNPGSTGTGTDKGTAQDGNVSINGDKNGPTIIDGGSGWAILANGRANVDLAYATVATNAISMTNFGTSKQIPDYTAEGSADQLFDFNRFIAVADLTPNGYAPSGNNHFTNLATFISAQQTKANVNSPMEGVVVVNIKKNEMGGIDSGDFPKGINIRGTLIFNFAADVGPWDKIINTATMNINAADLSGLVANNPLTYTSGYPPVYSDTTKNPVNINITSRGFQNFQPGDDLPALMYSIGILDMHGNVNISGVVYTPSFMEIENKQDSQIQYFRGMLVGGTGVYVENQKRSTSIVSYDPNTLDMLATSMGKGMGMTAVYWK